MGRRKGQAPKSYLDGNLISLADRTPEERRAIAMKSVEARRKKKAERMALQKCMRELLMMRPNSDKQKQVLKSFGFTDADVTNKTVLMVALFQKGLRGDVTAIKEITDMMDKLDMFEETGKATNNVTINLVPVGESYHMTEADKKEIEEAENYDPENDDDSEDEWDADEEWGDDVYDP